MTAGQWKHSWELSPAKLKVQTSRDWLQWQLELLGKNHPLCLQTTSNTGSIASSPGNLTLCLRLNRWVSLSSRNAAGWKLYKREVLFSAQQVFCSYHKIVQVLQMWWDVSLEIFSLNRDTATLTTNLPSLSGRNEMAGVSRTYCKSGKICSGRWCLRWKNSLLSKATRQGVGNSWGKMWVPVCKRSFPFFNMFAAVKISICQRLPGCVSISMKTGAERSSGNKSQVRNDNKCLGSYSSTTGWTGLACSCCFPFSQSQGLQPPSSFHTSAALQLDN